MTPQPFFLLALLAISPLHAQDVSLGPIERVRGMEACLAHLETFPADRMKLANVNGHLARVESSDAWGAVVDVVDAKRWCRHGLNRIRVDVWEEATPPADPYSIF